jgi:hypothetical protein
VYADNGQPAARRAFLLGGETAPDDWPVHRTYFDLRGLPHRFLAAFRVISARRFLLITSARAFPPLRPSATSAGSLPSSLGLASSLSPVAILATMMAAPITSAGRFSPLGSRCISFSFGLGTFAMPELMALLNNDTVQTFLIGGTYAFFDKGLFKWSRNFSAR